MAANTASAGFFVRDEIRSWQQKAQGEGSGRGLAFYQVCVADALVRVPSI